MSKSKTSKLNRLQPHIMIMFLAFIISINEGHYCLAQQVKTGYITDKVKPLFKQDTLTVCFMGDMMMHTEQIETALRNNGTYNFSSYFKLIENKIKDADLAVANMEFTLGGLPYAGYPCFSAPDSFATHLADCGFDIFLTANNHIFDRRGKGAARTLEQYRKLEETHGIRVTGLAEDEDKRNQETPLIIRRKGIRLAFINFTYGTNSGSGTHWPKTNYMNNTPVIESAVNNASKEADLTIILPHWGTEYQLHHSEEQKDMAEWLVNKGADIIIGTHPHVVQDTSHIKGIQVAYSLGNAVSNMSAANTQLELMATLKVIRKNNGDIETLPLELTWLWCSRPGGFCNDYIIIPVEEYIGKEEEWLEKRDYHKMVTTYKSIRNRNN